MKHPNRLAEVRIDSGLTQEAAADAMGMSLGGYRKLEYGERRLKAEQIATAAKAFSVPESDILASIRSAPVMGKIGAGAEIEPEFEQVQRKVFIPSTFHSPFRKGSSRLKFSAIPCCRDMTTAMLCLCTQSNSGRQKACSAKRSRSEQLTGGDT